MKYTKILQGVVVFVFLFFLFYINWQSEILDLYLDLPVWFIPAFTIVGILLLVIHYVWLLFRVDRLDFEFTSIVNHVFRTPLTRIMWIKDELEKDLLPDEKELYLQSLENSTTRILDIVDIIAGIKNVKSKEGYLFQAINLREIIEKSLDKYKNGLKEKNISLNVASFKNIPLLTVDLKKISFVIDVLIENAISYTQKDGSISIEAIVKSKKIIIAVSDSGIGLSFKERMKIFSRFYRTGEARRMYTDGMGLGLYLSKIIVKRHDGRIYAKSKGRGMGTTFFLELPFSKK